MRLTSVLPRAGLVLLAATIIGLGIVLMHGDSRAASFNPTATVSLTDAAAGDTSDIAGTFDIPGPDPNFENLGVINFTPGAWGIGACPANDPGAANATCADQSIPDGAYVGHLSSTTELGLLNGPCNTNTPVNFDMMDATTNTSTTVIFGDDPNDADTQGEQFEDDNSDGIPNGAQMYPDYLVRLVTGATPIQRLYGQTNVAGTDVSLNFMVFAPGVTINGQFMDPSLGFPSLSILQDTGDPMADPIPSAITDFCTPLSVDLTSYGMTQDNPDSSADESGIPNRTNPDAGSYDFVTYARSQRDADGDGIENALDPCPTDANDWDPRTPSGITNDDTDGDGIPNECDTTSNVGVLRPGR